MPSSGPFNSVTVVRPLQAGVKPGDHMYVRLVIHRTDEESGRRQDLFQVLRCCKGADAAASADPRRFLRTPA
jgi:hypothetical protein